MGVLIFLLRCARNCFLCPHCDNTLAVNATDPSPTTTSAVAGEEGDDNAPEPTFYLYCNFCRWSSAEAGIVFDKPTGVARAYVVIASRS